MELRGTFIEDTFAEAFRMWAMRVVITACNDRWLDHAVREVTGYGTSVIGCDVEARIGEDMGGCATMAG